MKQEERTKLIKERIIASAQTLFFSKGYNAVTISEIAQTAQVSRVTLFKYFCSKDELAVEAIRLLIKDSWSNYAMIIENKDMSFFDKFNFLLENKKERISQLSDEFYNSINWGDEKIMSLFKEASNEYIKERFSSFIQQGQNEGAIDSSLDIEAIKDYFLMFSNFAMNNDFMRKGKSYQQSMINIFCYGLIKQDNKH